MYVRQAIELLVLHASAVYAVLVLSICLSNSLTNSVKTAEHVATSIMHTW